MSNYIHFTPEQKEQAHSTDLVSFLRSRGETLKRSGSEYEWKTNEGKVTVRGNLWFHQYEREGGDAIDFAKRFYNLNYPEAVQLLLSDQGIPIVTKEETFKEKKPFKLPKANSDMRRVYAYLLKNRFIDREVINYFAHAKMLYEDSEWKDLLTKFNGNNITYDEIGNPLSYRDGLKFTWIGRKLSSLQNNENVVKYTYNNNGIRTSKIINGIKTTYQLDETKIISETTNNNIKWYIYDDKASLIGFKYNGQVYYFEKNGQGDIVRIIDENGNFVSEYYYDAWGNISYISGDEEIASANPFRYRGYYQDNESGLYYLQSRYYDPVTGRFLNTDEIEYLGQSESIIGYNLFTYCENNPIIYFDPDGRVFKYSISSGKYTVSGKWEKSPTYSKSAWSSRTNYANCYAYALNMYCISYSHKLQPGELSGKNIQAIQVVMHLNLLQQ